MNAGYPKKIFPGFSKVNRCNYKEKYFTIPLTLVDEKN